MTGIRYQADNDLNKAIVRSVRRREPALDFRSAQEAHLDSVPDHEVLRIAALDGRILVTHDFQTMPEHFQTFVQDHDSPGVFMLPQDLPIGQAVESLILVWAATDANEWRNRLCLIPSMATLAIRPDF